MHRYVSSVISAGGLPVPRDRQNSPIHCTARFSSSVGPPLSRYIQLVLSCTLRLLHIPIAAPSRREAPREASYKTPTAAERVRYHIALSTIPNGTVYTELYPGLSDFPHAKDMRES
jgi:hypothetical protein